tara:strand:+ start:229 stop:378 length:150 start_codon:yes stop_codon:yes gene_type:complete
MFLLVSCAPKMSSTFVMPIPITYDEERTVATKHPVVPVYEEELNNAKAN